MVEISQRVYVEEDPSKRCRNFPTTQFLSYTECDDSFVGGIINKEVPGLVPIWQNDDLTKVSTKVLDGNGRIGEEDLNWCRNTRNLFSRKDQHGSLD